MEHGAAAGRGGRLREPLRDAGHELFTPTYTGLGDRSHLANPSIDLETHIGDIEAVFTFEDLRDVILVGHSYGGMVATGVADRVPDRIAKLVYLDAFVPRDGESVLDIHGPESAAADTRARPPRRRRLGDPAEPARAGRFCGGRGMADAATEAAAAEDLRAEDQAQRQRAGSAAELHLLHAEGTRRRLRPLRRGGPARPRRLALFRDRFRPHPERHGAARACRHPRRHHLQVTRRGRRQRPDPPPPSSSGLTLRHSHISNGLAGVGSA